MKTLLALFNKRLSTPLEPQQAVVAAINSADEVAFKQALIRLVASGMDLNALRINGKTLKEYIQARQRVATKNHEIELQLADQFAYSECGDEDTEIDRYTKELNREIKSYTAMLAAFDRRQILSCLVLAAS